MRLVAGLAAVASSRHVGHATRAARILNFVGTVRGAVTTVLVLSSAAGGAAAINSVRQELTAVPDETQIELVQPSAQPPASVPLKTAQTTLQAALAKNNAAAEELRKVAVLSGPALDQLIASTKRQMQLRYERGLAQLAVLLRPGVAGAEASDPSDGTVLVMNAVVQVLGDDFAAILARAAQAALAQSTGPTATAAPDAVSDKQPSGADATLLRADATGKLLVTFEADMRSANDLPRIATVSSARMGAIITDTKQRLRARYDQGSALLDTLVGPSDVATSATDSRVAAVNALVELISNDLNAILASAVKVVGAPTAALVTPPPPPAYVPPPRTAIPAAVPTASPHPTVLPTRVPTPSPTLRPRTATPTPRTAAPSAIAPRTSGLATPSPSLPHP